MNSTRKRFLATHAPVTAVRATFDSAMGPRGRITFVAKTPDGTLASLVWE